MLEDEEEILADPLATLQAPVPKLGFVAAIVKLDVAHCDISLPAAELGVLYTVPLADTFSVDAPVEAHVIFPLGVSDAPLATNADANLT